MAESLARQVPISGFNLTITLRYSGLIVTHPRHRLFPCALSPVITQARHARDAPRLLRAGTTRVHQGQSSRPALCFSCPSAG